MIEIKEMAIDKEIEYLATQEKVYNQALWDFLQVKALFTEFDKEYITAKSKFDQAEKRWHDICHKFATE